MVNGISKNKITEVCVCFLFSPLIYKESFIMVYILFPPRHLSVWGTLASLVGPNKWQREGTKVLPSLYACCQLWIQLQPPNRACPCRFPPETRSHPTDRAMTDSTMAPPSSTPAHRVGCMHGESML